MASRAAAPADLAGVGSALRRAARVGAGYFTYCFGLASNFALHPTAQK